MLYCCIVVQNTKNIQPSVQQLLYARPSRANELYSENCKVSPIENCDWARVRKTTIVVFGKEHARFYKLYNAKYNTAQVVNLISRMVYEKLLRTN